MGARAPQHTCCQRSSTLKLNTTNKISVIEQLAYKNKAPVIVLQETHGTISDKSEVPNFLLTRSALSRKHGLATFVHEQLDWILGDEFEKQSGTEL